MSDTVDDLLRQSRMAHVRYQEAMPRMVPNGHGGVMPKPGNLPAIQPALEEAQRTRLAAQALDPDHQDPAWQSDYSKGTVHDQLLAFYAAELAKVPA
jgi:hypothetical protein